jgi:two-component system response regulator FixJ
MQKPSVSPAVFIVDDDDAVRDSLEALVDSAGLAVESFSSGTMFLKAMAAERIGCVLLDVQMPDLSGLEIQARLGASHPGLRVIIITGHGDVPLAVKAMKAGAFDFIEKPFDDAALLDCVRHALAEAGREGHSREEPADGAAGPNGLGQLTPRERDVLQQLIIGNPNKVIAYELGISPRTVEVHRARVMEKMQARNLSHLVRMALAAGLDPEARQDAPRGGRNPLPAK